MTKTEVEKQIIKAQEKNPIHIIGMTVQNSLILIHTYTNYKVF